MDNQKRDGGPHDQEEGWEGYCEDDFSQKFGPSALRAPHLTIINYVIIIVEMNPMDIAKSVRLISLLPLSILGQLGEVRTVPQPQK